MSWLGTPRVNQADQPISFRTRKALALLVYLSVEGGSHTREKLVALLWPESDEARGRGMLRTTLAYLREALSPLDATYLQVGTQALAFDFNSDFDLDLHALQAAWEMIQKPQAGQDRGAAIRQLQHIIANQRGDFLEGFSLADAPAFDDWATLQREIWHSRLNLLYDTLSQWQFEAGDLAAARETATRWKAHDAYGERAPQRLMQIHFANGDRAAALEVYAAYGKMLAAEFGGQPAAELVALAARIRASAPARPASPPTPTAPELAFVGRVQEFAHLQTVYTAATQGQSQAVLLMGEAGIGKTRLTREFLHWATAHGATILSSRAFETGGEVPYQPIAQLLRHGLDQQASFAELLSTTWLAELSRLLPEVRERFPDLPHPQVDAATAQHRLLESITRLGEALATRAPLLLVIDDIQWADIPSLDALHYAMSRWTEHKTPVLLLLCTREVLATQKNSLQQWLTSFNTKLTLTQLALGPLTAQDTLALLSSLQAEPGRSNHAPATPDHKADNHKADGGNSSQGDAISQFGTFAQALFDETGGQPLYLVETIKALHEQKVLIPYQAAPGTLGLHWRTLAGESTGHFPLLRIIPNNVRAAILDRLTRLTPAAAAMLSAAAVLGQAATFRQLAEMAGSDQMTGLDALEELIVKHLLLNADQRGQSYVIAHDKIRDVIYAEITAVRRQVLHSRAVTAIHDGDPARIAYHALAAGMETEAFEYSIVAGDAALNLFAAHDAISHYETARKLLAAGRVPSVDIAKIQHLYINLGWAFDMTAQFEAGVAVYQELQTIAQQRADPSLRLAALVAQAAPRTVLYESYDTIRGEALAHEALSLARELGNFEAEANVLCLLIDHYRFAGRLPEAIRCGEQALALARQHNLVEQTADILNSMVKCHAFNGRLDLAVQAQQQASELWRSLNNLPMLADSLAGLAFLGRWAGDYDQSLALSAEAYSISHSIDNLMIQAYSILVVGYIHWDRGEVDRALAVMADCIALAERTTYLTPQIMTRAEMGAIYVSLRESQRGFALMHQALELSKTHLPAFRAYVVGLLARQYLRYNRLAEAEALIEEEKKTGTVQPFSFLLQWLALAEAELAFRQNDLARALHLTNDLLAAITQAGLHSLTPAVLWLRGQCFIATGQPEDARTALQDACTAAERLGSRRMLMQLLPLLATVAHDAEDAAHLHQQATAHRMYMADHVPPELRAILSS